MARAAERDWGFIEIARKFERDEASPRRQASPGRKWMPLPGAGTAHVGVWITAMALSLIGLVTLHIVLLQKNIEYSDLIREKNSLTAENARLSAEVSSLSSPERIEQIATGPLGMVPPEKMQYVYISPTGAEQSYAELVP